MADISKLQHIAQQQIALLNDLGLSSASAMLQSALDRVGKADFRVAIVGEYNRGKSLLLNVIAQQELFASSVIPQSTVNVLKNGANRAQVIRDTQPEEIDFSQLPIQPAKLVTISFQTDRFEQNMLFEEYPTITPTDAEGKTALNQLLSQSDLIIMVMACDSLLSNTENTFIQTDLAQAGHGEVIFICNMLDRLSPQEQADIRKNAMSRLLTSPKNIIFCSALNSFESGTLDEGLVQLQTMLKNFDETARLGIIERRIHRLINANMELLKQQVQEKSTYYDAEMRVYKSKIAEWYDETESLQTSLIHILDMLADSRRMTRQKIELEVSNFFRELAIKIDTMSESAGGRDYIHDAHQVWKSNMTAYAQNISQSVGNALKQEIASFEAKVETISAQIPNFPNLLPITFEIPSYQSPDLHINQEKVTQTQGQPKPVNLTDMPEVIVTAVASLAIGMVFMPLFVIPTGMLASFLLFLKRLNENQQSDHSNAYHQFKAELQRQQISETNRIADAVDGYFTQLRQMVDNRLKDVINQTQSALDVYKDSIKPKPFNQSMATQYNQLESDVKSI